MLKLMMLAWASGWQQPRLMLLMLGLPRLMLMMLALCGACGVTDDHGGSSWLALDVGPAAANAHDASRAQHCRW